MPDQPQQLLLSTADVATMLNCSPRSVKVLIATGVLPSILVGQRMRRIPLAGLRAYIDGLQAAQCGTVEVAK